MKTRDALTLAGLLAAALLTFSPLDCRAAGGAAECSGSPGAPGTGQECPVVRPAAPQGSAGAGAGRATADGAACSAENPDQRASAQDTALLEDLIDNQADRAEAGVEAMSRP